MYDRCTPSLIPESLMIITKVESIMLDKRASNSSITQNIPPKGVICSDFICTFAMPDEDLFDFYCNTKLSESSDMAKEADPKEILGGLFVLL